MKVVSHLLIPVAVCAVPVQAHNKILLARTPMAKHQGNVNTQQGHVQAHRFLREGYQSLGERILVSEQFRQLRGGRNPIKHKNGNNNQGGLFLGDEFRVVARGRVPQERTVTLADFENVCPCLGPWRNHGEYVSCMADAVKLPLFGLNTNQRGKIISQAAKKKKSECGPTTTSSSVATVSTSTTASTTPTTSSTTSSSTSTSTATTSTTTSSTTSTSTTESSTASTSTTSTPPLIIPCGGPCDDGNLCTIDVCDEATNTCMNEPVPCGVSEACDIFTGNCEDEQIVVPCVAVIDEWDRNNFTSDWADFRSQYPKRPFCLLVPREAFRIDNIMPIGIIEDNVNNLDGIDRTVVALVNRDDGDPTKISDWFEACGLGRFGPASIDFIGLFIDTSGSMKFLTVKESARKFANDMYCAGISVDLVFDSNERFLDPFFVSLKPPNGTTECGTYDELCLGGVCREGVCWDLDQRLGSDCSVYDELCESNACVFGKCIPSKTEDNSVCMDDSECLSGACGYNAYNSSQASQVCCSSGKTVRYSSGPNQDAGGWPSVTARYFCTESIPHGGQCRGDTICVDGFCRDRMCWGFDLSAGSECKSYDERCSSRACRDGRCVDLDQPDGSNCSIYDEMCVSNACVEGVCMPMKREDNKVCIINNDCVSGACGFNSYNASLASQVCCASKETARAYSRTSDGWLSNSYRYFCTGMPSGSRCSTDSMCESQNCSITCAENDSNKLLPNDSCLLNGDCLSGACGFNSFNGSVATLVCCPSGGTVRVYSRESNNWPSGGYRYFCTESVPVGGECSNSNKLCSSNFCRRTKCWGFDLPAGSECMTYDQLCSSGACRGGFCIDLDQPDDSNCSIYDESCLSNACVEGVCVPTKKADKQACTIHNDCISGACGFDTNDGFVATQVCCASGKVVRVSTKQGDGWPSTASRSFCTGMPAGTKCSTHRVCGSQTCLVGKCWDLDLHVGSECGTFDAICSSRQCIGGVCVTENCTNIPTVEPPLSSTTTSPPISESTYASTTTSPEATDPSTTSTTIAEQSTQALVLKLSTGAITAGDFIGVTAVLEEDDNDPIDLMPPDVSFIISSDEAEADGTAPVLSTSTMIIETFSDTRGVYSITASSNVEGQTLSNTEEFVVVPPSSMNLLYSDLSTAVNGVEESVAALERAIGSSDNAAIQGALDDLRVYRDSIDLEELRTTSIFTSESGFIPTAGQLAAEGYPATSDDLKLRTLFRRLVSNFVNMATALELEQDQSVLEVLNEGASNLLDEMETLHPTIHGWALARNHINYLYAIAIPRVIRAQVDATEREILKEISGSTRNLRDTRKLVSLIETSVVVSIRAQIIKRFYVPLLLDLARMTAVLAISSLLQQYLGVSSQLRPVTPTSGLDFLFNRSPSTLEVMDIANEDYPDRTAVVLIGSGAVAAELIKSLLSVSKNNEDAFDAFNNVLDATDGVLGASNKAMHIPDKFYGFGCYFWFDPSPNCKALEFSRGFENVIPCSSLCFTQPIAILAFNYDTGGAAVEVFNFFPEK